MSEPGKSFTGLSENIDGALTYTLGWITGIIYLVLEKENKFVRFHALQSIIYFGALSITSTLVTFLLGWIPVIGGLLSSLFGIVTLASIVFLAVSAYQKKEFKIPIIGEIVYNQINK